MLYFSTMQGFLNEIDAIIAGEAIIIGDYVRLEQFQTPPRFQSEQVWFVSSFMQALLITQGNTTVLEYEPACLYLYCGRVGRDGESQWATYAAQVRAKLAEHSLTERQGMQTLATDIAPFYQETMGYPVIGVM